MSGRHKHKKQKNKAKNGSAVPPNEPSREVPQTKNPKDKLGEKEQETVKIEKLFRKPESTTAVAGVGLAAIVAVVYFLQLAAMTDTVKITRKASERGERAWIKVGPIGDPMPSPNQPLQWPIQIKNIGKTPARNLLGRFIVEVVPNGSAPTFDYVSHRPIYRSIIGQIFPDDYLPVAVTRERAKQGSDTELEDYQLEQSEYDGLSAGTSYVAAHGMVEYDDIFHVRHWTRFCAWFPLHKGGSYSASSCATEGNNADENDEP